MSLSVVASCFMLAELDLQFFLCSRIGKFAVEQALDTGDTFFPWVHFTKVYRNILLIA